MIASSEVGEAVISGLVLVLEELEVVVVIGVLEDLVELEEGFGVMFVDTCHCEVIEGIDLLL